ncbi:MAG: hypothetical protein ACI9UD_002697 [Glaciecola sp.]
MVPAYIEAQCIKLDLSINEPTIISGGNAIAII